jgi:hypothetical protein
VCRSITFRQLDHLAAVHTGVLVVGLDDVAEKEGGAAVGVALPG